MWGRSHAAGPKTGAVKAPGKISQVQSELKGVAFRSPDQEAPMLSYTPLCLQPPAARFCGMPFSLVPLGGRRQRLSKGIQPGLHNNRLIDEAPARIPLGAIVRPPCPVAVLACQFPLFAMRLCSRPLAPEEE